MFGKMLHGSFRCLHILRAEVHGIFVPDYILQNAYIANRFEYGNSVHPWSKSCVVCFVNVIGKCLPPGQKAGFLSNTRNSGF